MAQTRIQKLNAKMVNFVDIFHKVWDGNSVWEHKIDFLKKIRIEHTAAYSKDKKTYIERHIAVTGQNFGFTIPNADAAIQMALLLKQCAEELKRIEAKEKEEQSNV